MRLRSSCDSRPVSPVWPTGCPWCPPAASSRGGNATSSSDSLIVIVIGLVLDARLTISLIFAGFTLGYLIAVIYRAYLFTRSSKSDALEIVTDEEALSVPDSELPFYTILLPAYNEASVILKLIENLAQMDYPASRLEVLLLIEEDDEETLGALRAADPPAQFRLVVVPPAEPRTKPKALNFGLTLARGDIVAVYDVEDTPDILQLRRAAVALGRFGPEVACLQGKLSYRNATQNIITRWFTVEYAMWFSFFLPGLASLGAPIPLGGTSNHFRRSALRALGRMGPVQRHGGLRPRHPDVPRALSDQGARIHHARGSQQRFRELGQATVPLVQGLPADVPHPPPLSSASSPKAIGLKGDFHLCAFVGRHPDPGHVQPALLGSDHRVVRRPSPGSCGRSSRLPCTTSAWSCGPSVTSCCGT